MPEKSTLFQTVCVCSWKHVYSSETGVCVPPETRSKYLRTRWNPSSPRATVAFQKLSDVHRDRCVRLARAYGNYCARPGNVARQHGQDDRTQRTFRGTRCVYLKTAWRSNCRPRTRLMRGNSYIIYGFEYNRRDRCSPPNITHTRTRAHTTAPSLCLLSTFARTKIPKTR